MIPAKFLLLSPDGFLNMLFIFQGQPFKFWWWTALRSWEPPPSPAADPGRGAPKSPPDRGGEVEAREGGSGDENFQTGLKVGVKSGDSGQRSRGRNSKCPSQDCTRSGINCTYYDDIQESLNKMSLAVSQAFFLTSVAKKTNKQAQNSSQKLNLGEALSSFNDKLKKNTQFYKKVSKNRKVFIVYLFLCHIC